MKKIFEKISAAITALSVALPLTFMPTTAFAATLFNDGFESGSASAWTSADDDWSVTSGSGHSGNEKAQVSDQSAETDVLQKDISTTGYNNLVLSYYFKAGQDVESDDHIYVEWWDGASWQLLNDINNISTGGWSDPVVSHNLPVGANNLASFKFRFRAVGLEDNTGGGDKDEFQLDDVTLTGDAIIVADDDADDDGVLDDDDNCVNDANTDQADNDLDDIGDVCDPDDDNDGDLDGADNCPLISNADQADNDEDGIGDVCDPDDDNDTILDEDDNCPINANLDQADTDDDGIGDVCDSNTDTDDDGIQDELDNCPFTANAGQEDVDQDGIGDVCDNCVNVANPDQADTNDDNVGDVCEEDEEEIPVYEGDNSCPVDTEPVLLDTYSISATDADGETIALTDGVDYLFKAFGTFVPTSAPNYFSDAGYTTADSWSSLATQYGIAGTGDDYGAHALLADLGDGVGVLDWGTFATDHIYQKHFVADGTSAQFVIGDRYGDWFATPYQNQTGMSDNSGQLSLEVYQCQSTVVDPVVCAVSDTADQVVDGGAAVLVGSPNGAWATLSGANWIWSTDPVTDPAVNETVEFEKEITIAGVPTAATLEIATDNSYELYVDNVLVASDPSEFNYSSADTIDLTTQLTTGDHTLRFKVTNKGVLAETNPLNNPAGLLYRLTVTGGVCSVVTDDDNGGGGDGDATRLRIKKETPNSYGEFNFVVAGTDETNIEFSIETESIGDSDSHLFDGIEADTYTITEEVPTGWELSSPITCEYESGPNPDFTIENGGSVVLEEGDEILCTFVNTATTGFVTVTKEVINDDGEQEDADNFTIMVMRENDILGQAQGSEDGVVYAVSAGEYEVVEDPHGHYDTEYSGECSGMIAVGEYKECTVINDDRDVTGGSGNNSGNNGGGSVLGASTDTSGSVLGALTCSFLTYEQLISIKDGVGADPSIVRALQGWLNSSQNAGLTVNGIYDGPTRFAIMLLQEKYASEALTPWGLTKATGNVWLTTGKLILRLVCGEIVALPPLVPFNS